MPIGSVTAGRPFFLLFLLNRKGWLEAGSIPVCLPTMLTSNFCLLHDLSLALNLIEECASTTHKEVSAPVSFADNSLQH